MKLKFNADHEKAFHVEVPADTEFSEKNITSRKLPPFHRRSAELNDFLRSIKDGEPFRVALNESKVKLKIAKNGIVSLPNFAALYILVQEGFFRGRISVYDEVEGAYDRGELKTREDFRAFIDKHQKEIAHGVRMSKGKEMDPATEVLFEKALQTQKELTGKHTVIRSLKLAMGLSENHKFSIRDKGEFVRRYNNYRAWKVRKERRG